MPQPPIKSTRCQAIVLADINLQADDYRITTREDTSDLLKSIQHTGLINPPLLIKQDSGYAVVSGFRRIAACRELGWQEISACILASTLSPFECLRLAITENAFQRPLNLIEISRAFQKLSSFLSSFEQLATIASICGLPTNHSIIKKIKNLCLLPPPIQNCILKDTISLTMANELAMLETDTATKFARLFEQLKISLNKQKEIVTLCREIARRQDISIRQVLSHERFQQIISDEDLDRGQKGRQIRSLLREWRFPRIVEAEQNYANHVKELKLGPDIKLFPPKDFEGPTYTLSLSFTNLAHLNALQSMLYKIIQHSSFTAIVEGETRQSDK